MIDPYGSVLEEWRSRLDALGLVVTSDSEYVLSMSRGSFSLELSTDPHQVPSLSVGLRGPSGKVYEVGTLEELLAPEAYARELSEVRPLALQVRSGAVTGADRDDALLACVRRSVEGLCEFLSAQGAAVFDTSEPYRAAYEQRSREKLARLGVMP